MEKFAINFIVLGAIYAYGALAIPAEPRFAADARVQNWAAKVNVRQALSVAEKNVGRSILNKLDRLMVDKSSRRPGVAPRYIYDMDLQLIMDSSGSIGSSEFSKGKNGMKTIVDYVHWRRPISKYGSQVGLIEFSTPSKTHVEFSMGDYTSRWSVNNAIQRVGYDSGYSTATANALRLARTEINQNGANGNVKSAWILTDGNSNTGGNPRTPARVLKRMGVTVCVFAIGGYINMNEINAIATPGCVFRSKSFSRFAKIMDFASAERRRQQSPALNPNFFSGIRFS